MFEKKVAFISLGISALSIIFNFLCIQYQTIRKEKFEKEKITLTFFADFLALCTKINQGSSLTASEEAEFLKLNARLALIADDDIFNSSSKLIEQLVKNPTSFETECLITAERNILQKRLKIFNRF